MAVAVNVTVGVGDDVAVGGCSGINVAVGWGVGLAGGGWIAAIFDELQPLRIKRRADKISRK